MSRWRIWVLLLVWVPLLGGVFYTRNSIRDRVETYPFENFEIAIFALLPFCFVLFTSWFVSKAPIIRKTNGEIAFKSFRRIDIIGMFIGAYMVLYGIGATIPIVLHGKYVFRLSLPYLLLGTSFFLGAYMSRRFWRVTPQSNEARPVIVKRIIDFSKDSKEAIVLVSDGEYECRAFCHPSTLKKGDILREPLHTLMAENIQWSDFDTLFAKSDPTPLGEFVVAEIIDVENQIVRLGNIIIEVDGHFPGDVANGEIIEFSCGRLDIY